MKKMKKILSLFLIVCMVVANIPTNIYAAEMKRTTSHTIIAMSDYQNSSLSSEEKKTVPQEIVNAMKDNVNPELALLCGDYVDGSVGADGSDTSAEQMMTEFNNLKGILTSAWSGLEYRAIQGNHDKAQWVANGTLDRTGAYEYDDYIVYLINEDNFPWWQGNYNHDSGSTTTEDKETVTKTANALETYTDNLIAKGDTRPVIIATHVPMHWSVRSTNTAWYYDNIYANILFDVVNKAAENLDILFLFGHNHSATADKQEGGYDVEIGGALSYVAKGESMKVPNGTDGTNNYTTEKLNFTYMNAGYVGKYNESTKDCSISAITINENTIDIARYTYKGGVVNEKINLTHSSGDSSNNAGDSNSNGNLGDSNDSTDNSNGNLGDSDNSSGNDDAANGPSNDGSNESNDALSDWVALPSSDGSVTYKAIESLDKIDSSKKYMAVVWRYFGDSSKHQGYVFHNENNGNIQVSTGDNYATVTSKSGTIDDGCYWKMSYNSSNSTVTMQNVSTGKYLGKSNIVANSLSAENLSIASGTYSGYTNYAIGSDTSKAIRYSNSKETFSYSSNALSSSVTSANACNITIYEVVTASASDGGYARLTGQTTQTYDVSQNPTLTGVLSNITVQTSKDGTTVDESLTGNSSEVTVTWNRTFDGSKIGTYVGTVSYQGQTLGTVTANISGTASDQEGTGDWVQVADGKTTYIYEQATSITAGNKYVIVGNDNAVALMNNSGSMGSQSVTIDVTTLTSDVKLSEWTFSGESNGTIKNENYYLRYSNGYSLGTSNNNNNLSFGKGDNSSFSISYAQKGRKAPDENNTRYYFYYDGSNWTASSSKSKQYVRLYQYKETSTSAKTYARLTGTLDQAYTTADATKLSTVLGKVKIETSTDQSTAEKTVSVTSKMVTWDYDFDGSTAGVYTGTVTYEGKELGKIQVTVQPVSVERIELVKSEGYVSRGSKSNTVTGGKIKVTYTDGKTKEVDVTLGMLNNDGKTVGTYEGLTVTYGGKTATGFTLTVTAKEGNDYPSYPDEGAVKVGKNAAGIDFQSTGVAKVELTASGIPMNEGTDVVVVLDTSSSMQETVGGFDKTRLEILRPALNSLIKQLQATREDGSEPDLDISIVCFNGFTGNGNSTTEYGADNYIEVKAYKTPNEGGILTNKTRDGWVDIMDLATNWADADQNNITTGSGTNYDEGLLLAYKQLADKKESWEDGETRQQFVVFMSDGAPFQYNGVYSNYTSTKWNNWLLGNYETEDDIPNTVTNKEYYAGYAAGNGQDHRIAEAIKGDPNQEYEITTTTADTDGKTELKKVSGLGATMYSIGYLLEANGQVLESTQDTVLKNMASESTGNSKYYFDVDTAEELDKAFSAIATDVLMAAYNAYYVDTLGERYNIQMASSVRRASDGETIPLSEKPAIEIRQYEIWTRAEYDNEDISNLDLVGTRKTDDSGNYKYSTLEEVTFNDNGTEAYTGGDTSKNILVDGVICANTFWYNTNLKSVMIDKDGDGTAEFELEAETFLWKIGTITTYELAMTYFVYLDGSMEGNRDAGSYATNKSAILYYDNYLGNPCYKETVSPTMAWKAATVSYAFYLVDQKGNPVNMDGTIVPFTNRTIIVDPTVYSQVLLNSNDNETTKVVSLGVLSKEILPEGYYLYNENASYKVTINSDSTGSWEITDAGSPVTTYVCDFNAGDNYSNKLIVNDSSYEYTHTTVWFAVKWEPKAIADTVVVDYGLPVDVHVMTNDMFGNYGTLEGVTKGDVTGTANKTENSVTTIEAEGSYGKAKVKVPSSGANESNSVVRYTPSNMEMNGYDVFTYSVHYNNTNYKDNNGYYYGTVTVIPATSIYYEEDFVTYSSYTWDDSSNGWKSREDNSEESLWKKVTDSTYSEDADITQDEDRPGNLSFAFDTVIDKNNVYGYDSAYTKCANYSLGSAMKAQVDYDNYAAASFSFYGTGFDVISLTSNQTGSIQVIVKDENGDKVRNTFVDTYYGYTKDKEGNWVVSKDTEGALYQVPVMEIAGLDYGRYTVEIRAIYDKLFDHSQYSDAKYDFYLDAIRIYDPANDGNLTKADGSTDSTIQKAYTSDNEGWPVYEELRNNVIDAAKASESTDKLNGIVFIDGISSTVSVEDYTNAGPNNELYLASGQGIVFNLDLEGYTVASVQLGMKSADGKDISYKIFNGEKLDNKDALSAIKEQKITTSTGMYYDITSLKDKTIVVYNSGESGILSLTDIKITFQEDPVSVENVFCVSSASLTAVVEAMNTEAITVFEPEVFEVSVPDSVTVKSKITVRVTTSTEVAAVRVDNEMLTKYSVDKDGNRLWTKKLSADQAGSKTITAVAYDENNVASEEKTVTVTINSIQTTVSNVIDTVIGMFKKWFKW